MGFIRFVIGESHPDSGVQEGLFHLAYQLRDSGDVAQHEREELAELMKWFDENLPVPGRFNRSSSKGYDRRATRGIAWYRDSADECVQRMYRVKGIFENNGCFVRTIHQERVGYVVYEDEYQVVAEPFADTQTGTR